MHKSAFAFLANAENTVKYQKALLSIKVAKDSPVKYGLGTIYDAKSRTA